MVALPGGAIAAVTDTWTDPYPGVRHLHRISTDEPWVVDAVEIDTTYLDLSFRLTGSVDRGHTVSAFAQSYDVQVAWNGDLFLPLNFEPEGFAMGGPVGNPAVWPNTGGGAEKAFIYFARTDRDEVGFYGGQDAGPSPQPSWVGAVGGRPVIVSGGVAGTVFDCSDAEVDPCNPQPRTAMGVSMRINQPPQYLYAAVVSGRSAQSRGMRMDELAALMAELGAFDALALDGGSSSTLYIRNQMGVVNQPADGVERLVANHIGVRYDPSPVTYTIDGRVSDVANDVAIAGASVVRDDNVTVMTTSAPAGADNYSFSGSPIPARYVCVRVHKTGFRTGLGCKEINPSGGSISYLNVRLTPGQDPPDAGTPDAPRVDAAPPRLDANSDAPVQRDGGNSFVGDSGCSCNVGRVGSGGGTWLLALAGAALLRRRRR